MWIVRLALQRPRMIAVMSILIFILGGLNILQMPKDIFPQINLPVVAVVWSYPGLAPEEVDRRVLRVSKSFISASVSNIERIESQALSGTGVIKVYFQPGTEISEAIAQNRDDLTERHAYSAAESRRLKSYSMMPPTCLSCSWCWKAIPSPLPNSAIWAITWCWRN